MAARERGRGRLGFIDKLPEECREDVDWAIEELKARQREQKDILEEFNLRLCSKGVDPVSKSSFNRYSLKLARHWGAMMQVREAAAAIAEKFDEEPDGDVALLIGETIKTLIYEAVSDVPMDDASASIKMLAQAAHALQRLEQARGTAIKTALIKREKFIKDAAAQVEQAMKQKGIGPDTIEAVKKAILGVPDAEDGEE